MERGLYVDRTIDQTARDDLLTLSIADPGRQANLTTRVCADLPGMSCDYEDIAYDAYSTDYCPSVDSGEGIALDQINAYYAKCPESAIVLSGYSEGATVLGNVLAGDGGDVYCPSSGHPGLTDTTSGPSCNIAAITLFGNPRHTANQPYNVLAGSAGQANSHRDAAGLARMALYTPRLHDYCNYDDLICAPGLGANTVEAHTDYFELYSAEAAQYIADTVKGYSKGKYCPLPTTSSSSSSASATSSLSSSASVSTSSGNASVSTMSSSSASGSTLSGSASVTTSLSASGSTTVPVTSTYSASSVSSPASVPYITVTDVSSVYTTTCTQTSVYTTNNQTRTSTFVGPTTITSTLSSTLTTTVAATYVASTTPLKESSITTLSGTPAVIDYTTSISTTTYANFPTLTFTNEVPTATYWLNSQGMSNGTKVTGVYPSGSGVGSAYPTSTAPIEPYTGAASASGVAAKWLAVAAGVIGLMML